MFEKLLQLLLLLIFIVSASIMFYNTDMIVSIQKAVTPFRLRFYNSTNSFSPENYRFLYELGILGEQSKFLDPDWPLPEITFVTATSDDHVGEARALVKQVYDIFPNKTVIMYDLGLSNVTRKWFEEACNVELRTVNISHFGVAENLKKYRWKPIVIAKALQDFPVVFWMDTSTEFLKNRSWGPFFGNLSAFSEEPHVFILSTTHHSTFAATDPGMYKYLEPQFDATIRQAESGKIVFVRTKNTYEMVMKWWVLCALEKKCMDPTGAEHNCKFKDELKDYAGCHRYDQSALHLIVGKYRSYDYGELGKEYLRTSYNQRLLNISAVPACT